MSDEYREINLIDFDNSNFIKYGSIDDKNEMIKKLTKNDQEKFLISLLKDVPEEAIILLVKNKNINNFNIISELINLAKKKDITVYEPILFLAKEELKIEKKQIELINSLTKNINEINLIQMVRSGKTINIVKESISKSVVKTVNILNKIPITFRQTCYDDFINSIEQNQAMCDVSIHTNDINVNKCVRKFEKSIAVFNNTSEGQYSPINSMIKIAEKNKEGICNNKVKKIAYEKGNIWNQLFYIFKINKDYSAIQQKELTILKKESSCEESVQFIRLFHDIANIKLHVDKLIRHGTAKECYQAVISSGNYIDRINIQKLYKISQKEGREWEKLSILEKESFYLSTFESSFFEFGINKIKKSNERFKECLYAFAQSIKKFGNNKKNDEKSYNEKKNKNIDFNHDILSKIFT